MHASSSNNFSSSVYEEKVESEEKVDVEDIEIDHEEEKVQDAGKRVTREEILREMIVTSNGRDKVFVSDIRIELPNDLSLLRNLFNIQFDWDYSSTSP